MGIMGYSKDELAELSEEELEGLKELEAAEAEEGDDGDEDALNAGDDTATDDAEAAAEAGDDDDDSNESPDEAAADKADAQEDPAEDGGEDGDADDTPDGENEASNTPKPTFVAPEDLDKRLNDIGKEKDAIAEKFDDGEITAAEHRQQLKELDEEEWSLRSQQVRAKVSEDILARNFVTEATRFVNASERFKPGTRLYKMLDREVRDMQEADPENMYDPTIIARAAASIEQELGLASAKPPAGDPKDTPNEDGKGKKGKKGLADIPPTLADIPASDPNEDDGGEFAAIDRLDGEAHERALAKLSPQDRERYMQS
jgi:hypothetical protein